ncbi:MAG: hypothetical protein O3A47_05770 [Chloroflexi bacterium]|nr:hypothetical protein [Chloroflexota bacterium]
MRFPGGALGANAGPVSAPAGVAGKRRARLAKSHRGWGVRWMPNKIGPAQVLESWRTLDRLADEAGRDPSSSEVTVVGQPVINDTVRRFRVARADREVVPDEPWIG